MTETTVKGVLRAIDRILEITTEGPIEVPELKRRVGGVPEDFEHALTDVTIGGMVQYTSRNPPIVKRIA